jgi:hypothetical protein
VTFSNNNFTDILFGMPVVDSSACAAYFGSPVTTLAFMAFDNPALFEDVHSYPFNTSLISIPATKV